MNFLSTYLYFFVCCISDRTQDVRRSTTSEVLILNRLNKSPLFGI